jgi:hypothetical protein
MSLGEIRYQEGNASGVHHSKQFLAAVVFMVFYVQALPSGPFESAVSPTAFAIDS